MYLCIGFKKNSALNRTRFSAGGKYYTTYAWFNNAYGYFGADQCCSHIGHLMLHFSPSYLVLLLVMLLLVPLPAAHSVPFEITCLLRGLDYNTNLAHNLRCSQGACGFRHVQCECKEPGRGGPQRWPLPHKGHQGGSAPSTIRGYPRSALQLQ